MSESELSVSEENIREKVQYYMDHGMSDAARQLLEFLLANSRLPLWIDLYKYLLILERLGEYHLILKICKRWQTFHDRKSPNAESLFIITVLIRTLIAIEEKELSILLIDQLLDDIDKVNLVEPQGHSIPESYMIRLSQKSHKATLLDLKSQILLTEYKTVESKDLQNQWVNYDAFYKNPKHDIIHAHEYLKIVKKEFEMGNYYECIKILSPKTLIDPNWKSEMLAICYCELRMQNELEYLTQLCNKESPSSPQTLFITALFHQLKDEHEDARRLFALATQNNEHYKPAWLCLGHSYSAIGDHEQALSSYSRILRYTDESCINTLISMASEYLRVDKHVLASPYLHSALSIEHNDPFALNELGILFYIRDELEKAINTFKKTETILKGSPFCVIVSNNRIMSQLMFASKTRKSPLLKQILDEVKEFDISRSNPFLLELLSYCAESREEKAHLLTRAIASTSLRPDFHNHRRTIVSLIEEDLNLT